MLAWHAARLAAGAARAESGDEVDVDAQARELQRVAEAGAAKGGGPMPHPQGHIGPDVIVNHQLDVEIGTSDYGYGWGRGSRLAVGLGTRNRPCLVLDSAPVLGSYGPTPSHRSASATSVTKSWLRARPLISAIRTATGSTDRRLSDRSRMPSIASDTSACTTAT